MPYLVPLQGNPGGKRTLVFLEDISRRNMYSTFFADLENRGHALNFVGIHEAKFSLKKYGEYLFDNIVAFVPSDEITAISMGSILTFVNDGGNVLFATTKEASEMVRLFAEGCGAELDNPKARVVDHFSFHQTLDEDSSHSTILTYGAADEDSGLFLGEYSHLSPRPPVLYRGIGHAIDDGNVFATRVLRGNPTTYSADPTVPIKEYPENAGSNTLLVSAFQARNNARVTISGSIDLFSDQFFSAVVADKASRSTVSVGNRLFCTGISRWTFAEGGTGVLRFSNISHHRFDGSPPDVILHEKDRPDLPQSLYPDPEITRNSLVYRIKDEIVYSMVVEELRNDGRWAPFATDDMQMEFVMLDPYVRKTMEVDRRTGRYNAVFIAPDDYGIFKFRVLYRRKGYSVLHAETQVSIRPYKHNEYERFIATASPYYISSFSMLVAFFMFSLFFLFSTD